MRLLSVVRTRESTFSYTCNGCNRCCYDKRIQLNPYEVARLARNRAIATGKLIERYTVDGTALRTRGDGACVFLGESGCTVHPDRPLACRLYPLGRVGAPDGTERFVELEPHPRSAGCYEGQGTVASYLEEQGVEPYLRVARRYRELLSRMVAALQGRLDGETDDGTQPERVSGESSEAAGLPDATDLLDVDAVVADHCRALGRLLPSAVDESIELHIEALKAWLGRLETAGSWRNASPRFRIRGRNGP